MKGKRGGVEYYIDRYGNGFWHYLKMVSFKEQFVNCCENVINNIAEAIPLLGWALLGFVTAMTLPLTWIPARIYEYKTCKKELPGLIDACRKTEDVNHD